MRWIEIIQLRTTDESKLEVIIDELGSTLENETVEVAIYRHANVATDLSIHLVHETDGEIDRALGQRLVATLEEQGLVNQSRWFEV